MKSISAFVCLALLLTLAVVAQDAKPVPAVPKPAEAPKLGDAQSIDILTATRNYALAANQLNAKEKEKEREIEAVKAKKDAEIEALKKEVAATQKRLNDLVDKVQVPGYTFNVLTLKYEAAKPAPAK